MPGVAKKFKCLHCSTTTPEDFGGGRKSVCKDCLAKGLRARNYVKPHNCNLCGDTDVDNFNGTNKSICRDCVNRRMREARDGIVNTENIVIKKTPKVKVRILTYEEAERREALKKESHPNLAVRGLQSILDYCEPPTYKETPKKPVVPSREGWSKSLIGYEYGQVAPEEIDWDSFDRDSTTFGKDLINYCRDFLGK